MDLIKLKQVIKSNKGILILLLLFTIVYTLNLDKYPLIWTDEAWFSNPAYNLAFHGFLGTTMMPDFYNIAHYTYWQMPFYMVLMAISFKLFGFGIIQARMISVVLGFFTVLFTYLLGKELYNKKIGLLASILLIVNPLFFLVARQARMDIAVTCFTLIALYFLLKALKVNNFKYYIVVGLFAMLSVLSHPNGLFGVICIALIYFVYHFRNLKSRIRLKEIGCMVLSSILLVTPYLWYISLDFPDFMSQFKANILNSANSPLINLLTEYIRYLWTFNLFDVAEGQIVVIVLIIMACLVFLGLIYIFKNRSEFRGKFLITILAVHVFLFAFLISQKYATWYLGIILPYFSILIALPSLWGLNHKKGIQTSIIVVLCLFIAINALGLVNILYTTNDRSYQAIYYDVEKYVPNGSIVLGDPALWVTLHDNYSYYDYHNLSVSTSKKVGVEYLLVDNYWAINESYTCFKGFLKNNCTLIGEIPYSINVKSGPIEIYRVNS